MWKVSYTPYLRRLLRLAEGNGLKLIASAQMRSRI